MAVCLAKAHPAAWAAMTSPQKNRVICRLRLSVTFTRKSTGRRAPFHRICSWVGLPSSTPQVLFGCPMAAARW